MSKKNISRLSVSFDTDTREGVVAIYYLSKCKPRKKASFIAKCIFQYVKDRGYIDEENIDIETLMDEIERDMLFQEDKASESTIRKGKPSKKNSSLRKKEAEESKDDDFNEDFSDIENDIDDISDEELEQMLANAKGFM